MKSRHPPAKIWDAVVIGGGCAGLSAAIYLGRAMRRVLVVDAGNSLALWEPDVQNFFGFPTGISGRELLRRAKAQAKKYLGEFSGDEILSARRDENEFLLSGKRKDYRARTVLFATGVFHLLPEIPHVEKCIGQSMFFCKDCDGFRNQDKRIAIVGHNNDAVEYALGMICYAACVLIATNGKKPAWGRRQARWIKEYKIPVYETRVTQVSHQGGQLRSLTFGAANRVALDSLFTTRGDIFPNELARALGVKVDACGQIIVDRCMRTSVPGLYAAGCVTPANCQMIIAAGDGATAAQTINRDLFRESLRTHALCHFRKKQIAHEPSRPKKLSRHCACPLR